MPEVDRALAQGREVDLPPLPAPRAGTVRGRDRAPPSSVAPLSLGRAVSPVGEVSAGNVGHELGMTVTSRARRARSVRLPAAFATADDRGPALREPDIGRS